MLAFICALLLQSISKLSARSVPILENQISANMNVLPNLVLGLFLSVASIDDSVVVVKATPFYVVSPSSGSEKFFLKLSREGARDETPDAREDMACAAILNNTFFATDKNVELVDPWNVGAYARFHPEMKADWFMLKRPYEMVNVSVLQSETVQEAVFPCLAKFRGTDVLKMYLISHAYNFHRWIKRRSTKCPPVTGRFVFEFRDSVKNVAQLIAVAEEPACRLDYVPVHPNRIGDLVLELGRMDEARTKAICEFTTGRKVRICSALLNAKEYRRNGVTFSPNENRVEPTCERRAIVFPYHNCSSFFGQDTCIFTFNKWVIGCKAEFIGNPGVFATEYVSLGYEPYQLLVYHSNEKPILCHHFYSHLGMDNSDYYRSQQN